MNWGYKILFVYAIFVAGILFLVFKSSTQNTDLVTTNYYEKELKYQDKIDQENRNNALSAPIQYEIKDHELLINFPADFKGKKINGTLVLYCPANEKKDISQDFTLQDDILHIHLPQENKGLFELQINWTADQLNYYFQHKISIN